ncbi:MAG TPA: hypothetical protein VNP73_03875 [Actinomycetota bacterium]|nr:hypothetical protein [Actinomycetota bacterium]
MALVLLGACSSDDTPAPGGSSVRDAVAALCDARDTARDSVGEARDIFFNESHDPLHELARTATDEEPGAAAGLLEAKNAVEAAFEEGDDVEPELGTLISAANEALTAVSEEPVTCS